MKISVALAIFNGARFLSEQLASLANQRSQPHELVVRDDGSSDESVSIVEEFASGASFPVRIERNDCRLGFADTFLSAAAACKGDAIAFCDQDDVWLPNKLERCAGSLSQEGVLLVMHTSLLVDDRLQPTGKAFPRVRRDVVVPPLGGDPWLAVRGMSMVFSAELMSVAGGERPPSHYGDGVLNHDEWIYMLARGLGSVACVAEPLGLYRMHGANVTGDGGGAGRRVTEAATTGAAYYARRLEQARMLADLFWGVAAEDGGRTENARRAAAAYDGLAEHLRRRVDVYAAGSRRARVAAFRRARATGVYGARRGGGFGLRGLVRDAALVVAGRS
jgi:glycosyltransferase involved in cell wall biosynthesis